VITTGDRNKKYAGSANFTIRELGELGKKKKKATAYLKNINIP
jgi:hypothetical protein